MAKKKKKQTMIRSWPPVASSRAGEEPVFAVVRLRRQKSWVLPKGKLNRDETAIAAAKREVIEETGHDVAIQEYLGSLTYVTSGWLKIVKFWRMEAEPQTGRQTDEGCQCGSLAAAGSGHQQAHP